ncbi:helix-turn-helix domain-containing protein [Streptomyces chryseus]
MPTAAPAWVLTRREAIGARIRTARQDAGLSQVKLAELVGIDHKTVHRVEYGLSDPSLSTLLLIAHAVDVPLGDLVRQ